MHLRPLRDGLCGDSFGVVHDFLEDRSGGVEGEASQLEETGGEPVAEETSKFGLQFSKGYTLNARFRFRSPARTKTINITNKHTAHVHTHTDIAFLR